jgi:preprotein translocase subunit SecA
MLRELLSPLEDISQADELKQSLLEIARGSLDANKFHLQRAVDEQLTHALERLDDQVEQRVEFAEMAVDAAIYEAEEEGRDINPRGLLEAVEQAAGLRIQMDDKTLQQVREDPQSFQRRIREMVEASFGLRIWAGLIQAVERRIGESLNLQPSVSASIDWDQASADLQNAIESVWEARSGRILGEIETDLQNALRENSTLDAQERIRFLIQMSYGQRSFFDRKTHQRQSVKVARLTYPFYAANLISDRDPDELTEQIVRHLEGAQESLKKLLGNAAFSRLAGSKLDQLESRSQDQLRTALGQEAFDQYAGQGPLSSLSTDARETISNVLGSQALARAHRELFLSVGDREWVDYLTQMEALRTSIGLEAYGQRDPLVQYKSRAFDLFNVLLASIRAGVVAHMFRLRTTPSSSTTTKQASAPRGRVADDGKPDSTTKKPSKKRKRKRKRK